MLPWLSLCHALGIFAADRVGPRPLSCLLCAALALAIGLGLGVRRPHARLLAACGLAAAAGALALSVRLDEAARGAGLAHGEHTVEGTIEAVARRSSGYRVDLVDVVTAESEPHAVPQRLRVFGEREQGGDATLETGVRGTRVRARLRLRALLVAQNPGGRASERSAARRGYAAGARLAHPSLHVIRQREGRAGGVGFASIAGWAWARLDAARLRVGERLAQAGPGSGLVVALALGDRSGLRESTRRVFRSLGVSHLLAVSGLHLGLVASLAFGLAGPRCVAVPRSRPAATPADSRSPSRSSRRSGTREWRDGECRFDVRWCCSQHWERPSWVRVRDVAASRWRSQLR